MSTPEPTLPDPAVRPLPRDPGRPSQGLSPTSAALIGMAVVLILIVVTALAIEAWTGSGLEDQREVRNYGDLECVYNVDADVIEDCVAVPG